MKKAITLIMALMMILSLVVTPALALSNNEKLVVGEDNSVTQLDNTPYDFPVKPGSEEWCSFTTKQQMIDACQIPEEKLNSMSTEALLETVMNYPLINTYYCFNYIEDANDVMSADFNGFNELFARSDVSTALLNEYSGAKILTANEAESAEPAVFFKASTIEYLFACNEIKNGAMTQAEQIIFAELREEKTMERNESSAYGGSSEVYSTYTAYVAAAAAAGSTWTAVATGTVKTPKGSNVPQVYTRSPELTTAEKTQINNDLATLFPNATKIAEPTVKYNCHSYAWYNRSTSNSYWIGQTSAPSIYTTDGSYTKQTGVPRSGQKIWYNSGEHSGISIGARVEYGSQVHYVESKWGMAGVYEHAFSHSPYTASIAVYAAS